MLKAATTHNKIASKQGNDYLCSGRPLGGGGRRRRVIQIPIRPALHHCRLHLLSHVGLCMRPNNTAGTSHLGVRRVVDRCTDVRRLFFVGRRIVVESTARTWNASKEVVLTCNLPTSHEVVLTCNGSRILNTVPSRWSLPKNQTQLNRK